MKKVVLCPNPYRDRQLHMTREVIQILREMGIESAISLPFAQETAEVPKDLVYQPLKTAMKRADIMIAFGGDGSILHLAKTAAMHRLPILGINLGNLGYIAELESTDLPLLRRLNDADLQYEERMMLNVRVFREEKQVYSTTVLNDAVITKGAVARVIKLQLYLNQKEFICQGGDGMIFATPTGSTAYSLSAGGPIVEPTAENIIVTPICPHALSARSFVLGHERTVSIKLGRMARKTAFLSVDGGKAFKLNGGDVVETKMSKSKTRLVRVAGRTFYEILNHKLGGA